MAKQHLQIHSENILPIIKKWLYSDKDIFLRELISNSCDAIYKVKLLQDRGEIPVEENNEFRIDVKSDKDKKTLTISDNGVGMTEEEVEKYIAQIAFSGAEDFLSKYQTNQEQDQFIGHFGLGFYSSYMVSSQVDVETLSYRPGSEPVFWSCDGSAEYTIEKGSRQTRGTDIILHVDADSEEYLEKNRLKEILHHYCDFLPYPIYLDGERINTQEPLWVKSPSSCTDQEYLDFYRHLYPGEEDPLFWVHLNVDYPFHLKGILFFPKLRRDYETEKNTVKLFCNRVFVSDNCKDVIPNYLMALRGVIDSPDIPLNVSRSYLQMDRTVKQLGSHISKKVSDSLSTLYRNERERFLSVWNDVSLVVKLGILEDEKFYERVKEFLIWKETSGEWTTVEDYLERNKEKTKDRVLYTRDQAHHTHLLELYVQKGIEVICADHPVDPYVMQFLERKISPATFHRIDSTVDDNLVDQSRENTVLDAEGKTAGGRLADLVRSKLSDTQIEVEAKSLASDNIPGIVVMDEQQRRMRDYMMSLDPKNLSMASFGKKTFIVNTNSPLMNAAAQLNVTKPELAKELVMEAYELALLSQREMAPDALSGFISRSTRILSELAQAVAESK